MTSPCTISNMSRLLHRRRRLLLWSILPGEFAVVFGVGIGVGLAEHSFGWGLAAGFSVTVLALFAGPVATGSVAIWGATGAHFRKRRIGLHQRRLEDCVPCRPRDASSRSRCRKCCLSRAPLRPLPNACKRFP